MTAPLPQFPGSVYPHMRNGAPTGGPMLPKPVYSGGGLLSPQFGGRMRAMSAAPAPSTDPWGNPLPFGGGGGTTTPAPTPPTNPTTPATPPANPPAADPTNTAPLGTGPAFNMGRDMYRTGRDLLNGGVAGNGFGQVQLNPTTLNNPYVKGMIGDIRSNTNDMLGSALLGIQGNSVASGGLGGSRQGVAQGTALGKAADYMSGNISNLLGGMYENQANRNMQQYGMDMDFYGQQRGQDLAQTQLGGSLINSGLNTQWTPINNTANIYSMFSGLGNTTSTNSSGGGWQGALGGGLGMLGLGSQMGWW